MSLKVFFSFFLFCGLAYAIDDMKEEDRIGSNDQEASDQGALWFGPRLGKRSLRIRNEDNRQTFLRLLEAADALKYYYDRLPFYDSPSDDPETRVTKKIVLKPILGRNVDIDYDENKKTSDKLDFTPRLGRRLPNALPVTPPDDDTYRYKPSQVDRRTNYFSPRLGRKLNFSPRLGRELTYDIYPEKIRLTRSTNDSKTT